MPAPTRHPESDSAPDDRVTYGPLRGFADDPIACMRSLHRQHGDLAVLREGTQDLVFAFGPQWNQQILTEVDRFEARFFATRGPRNSAQRRLTGGLLSMNGELHQRHRRLVMEPFALKTIQAYIRPLVAQVQTFLSCWRAGETREIHRDMTRLMLGITSSILFGFDHPELALQLGQMLEQWVEKNHETGVGALVSDDKFLHQYEDLLEFSTQIEVLIQEMIRLRRGSPHPGNDVLSILIRTHDEQGGMSDEELIGQIAILFGAAHLTTASSLTWTLFLLAQHPVAMQAVHEEIQTHFKTPEFSELPGLSTMERVIKESMRVLPASAYLPRVMVKAGTLGPLTFPRGTPIIFSQFITHHLAELFDEPDRFQPDRWRTSKPSPYEYLPFAAGPRMCIGAPLAMMMLKVILPMILSRFRLNAIAGEEYGGLVRSTMLLPSTPIRMEIHPQDGSFRSENVRGNIHSLVELPGCS